LLDRLRLNQFPAFVILRVSQLPSCSVRITIKLSTRAIHYFHAYRVPMGRPLPKLSKPTPEYPPTPLILKHPNHPHPAPNHSVTDDKQETPAQLEQRMRDIMNQQKIVLFMKGDRVTPRCGFSRKSCALLENQKVTDFATFDILKDEKVRQGEVDNVS